MRILLLNQAFYPDVVSTAQHAADFALELKNRGHEVTVISSRRAYGEPGLRFCPAEEWNGVHIKRVHCLGLGKQSKLQRMFVISSFLIACATELFRHRSCDVVIAMTSPPLISFLGALFTRLKGGRFVSWIMDLNPDEAVAAGWLRQNSVMTKFLRGVLQYSLVHSTEIVVLDRFMKERVERKGIPVAKINVIPPWPHETTVRYCPEGRKAFRAAHSISDKFVVMYSGNHSPCHPLDTLLRAAAALWSRDNIVFCFAGGGSERRRVQSFATERGLKNLLCLPYQPIDKLSDSLSAADLHVVVMGDRFVGVVHPCKIYNILSLGVPLLYIGPSPSHVTDLLPPEAIGNWAYLAGHNESELVARHILAASTSKRVVAGALNARFSQKQLLSSLSEVIELRVAEPAYDPSAKLRQM